MVKFIVGTSLASRKTQDFALQDLSRKTLVARLARKKIYLSTLFFWLKLEVFSQKIKLGLTKIFFYFVFCDFYSEKYTALKRKICL